jgi:putative ABC transport system permease protein
MSTDTTLIPARLRPGDLARVASVGLRTRRLRAALSALGVAIGVAAIVAVLGLSSSSQAGLLAEIVALGTNLLTSLNLLGVIATVAQGSYLNAATATQPVAVFGAAAAQRLGIARVYPGERVWLGNMWFYVGGILNPAILAPEIDTSVLIGYAAAQRYLNYTSITNGKVTLGPPSNIYVRAQTSQVGAVQSVLGAAANPENPNEVNVSQPSSALAAEADAKGAFNGLFLGLGAVALLVGAVGVANIMIISVLERRSEIGLRRALGATRRQIRSQFLSEAITLGLLGGAAGVAAGSLATIIYASTKRWAVVIPAEAWGGGIAAAIAIGAIAGLLPAIRAARLPPTEALRTV